MNMLILNQIPAEKGWIVVVWLALLLASASPAAAQVAYSGEQPTLTFYELEVKSGIGKIRDFATSPLFYEGIVSGFSLQRIKRDHSRETSYGFQVLRGILGAEVDDRRVGASGFTGYFFHYTRLYGLPGLSNERWNVKVGGTVDANSHLRITPAFQNNQLGLEAIFTLSASAKVTRDISRTERKQGRVLFIDYSLPPRVRTLSYKVDLGFFNNNFRNGYIYSNQSGVLNDTNIFYDYEFNFFSGFRIGYDLDYTLYNRNNHNAFVVGLAFDAYTTGRDFEKLQGSSISLNVALLFNSKSNQE